MKRSEMIQTIATELCHPHTSFMAWDKCLHLAEVILKRIEKEGMKPPSYMKPVVVELEDKQYLYTPSQNEWERENNT